MTAIAIYNMPGTFLQSEEWLRFQEHIGHKTWDFKGKIVANVIRHNLPFGKNYLYVPHGPVIFFDYIKEGLKNEVDKFLADLKSLAKENRSIFIKMEPVKDIVIEVMYRKGIKRSNKSIQPSRTVILDLDQTEEEILSKMHHKTRYNINLAERKGLKFEETKDVKEFWKLLKKTAKKDKFQTHNRDYYEKLIDFFGKGETHIRVHMFFVLRGNKPIAGAIILLHEAEAYYLHGAMDRDYKAMMATYLLHWEIIKWLKRLGYHKYDLWGIDARRWPGVTRFKLGWGGETKEYPGSFDIPISKFWYLIYRIARKVF